MLEVAGGASDSPTKVPHEEPAAVALTQEEKKALRTLLVVELALVKRQIALIGDSSCWVEQIVF